MEAEESDEESEDADEEDFDIASFDPESFDRFVGRYELEAVPGFVLAFTRPIDVARAASRDSYEMTSYTYRYHATYGSPEIDERRLDVTPIVSKDRRSVRLVVSGLRAAYVHELRLAGIRSATGMPLLHPVAYYTLNRVPKNAR